MSNLEKRFFVRGIPPPPPSYPRSRPRLRLHSLPENPAQIASLRESISELNANSAELSDEISDREAQLEEALAAAQLLRAEQSRLQESVETSSARLAAEAEAGRAAREAAAAREEALKVALAATTVTAAVSAAEAAEITPPGEGDPEGAVVASLTSADAGEENGGGGGEGEGGGSPASARSSSTGRGGGQREGQSSGEPHAAGGAGKSAAAVLSGQPSARERELEEEVAALKTALDAARGVGSNGGRGGVGGAAGLGGKGSSLAAVLEGGDIGGEIDWLSVASFRGPVAVAVFLRFAASTGCKALHGHRARS